MKKIAIFTLFISAFIQAQFYEFTFETQVQTYYTEKGLKLFEEWDNNPISRQKTIEENKNPAKESFKFIYNDKLSKSEHIRRINNSQTSASKIFKLPKNINTGTVNNYQTKEFLFNLDVYGKRYLVKDNLFEIDLHETGKTKNILGFLAIEATTKVNDVDIIVWYTKQISQAYTPDIYYTPKGFILELHYKVKDNESEVINSWLAVNKKEQKEMPKIDLPTKGVVIKASDEDAVWEEADRKINEMNSQIIESK